MRRPALSAVRAIQILDRLAADPFRAFTMSEITRDTDINVASCHTILTAMTERGYLQRDRAQKTYKLGPVLAALGQTAFLSQPIITRAWNEAKAMTQRIGYSVLLTVAVGDEIVALFTLDDKPSPGHRLRVGQRVPFAPPLGAPFVAWSSEEAADAWLARLGDIDSSAMAEWRSALALVKQRGFQVTLRAPDPELTTVMNGIASGKAPLTAQREWAHYFEAGNRRLLQPAQIEPDALYPVVLIAAPLFDRKADQTYCFGISGFSEPIRGEEIETLAQHLLQSCVAIMRDLEA